MEDNIVKITCGVDVLKQFARHEIRYSDLTGETLMFPKVVFEDTEMYQITYDDILEALKSFTIKKEPIFEFSLGWYEPLIYQVGEQLQLNHLLKCDREPDLDEVRYGCPQSEAEMLHNIFNELDVINDSPLRSKEVELGDRVDFTEQIAAMENYKYNQGVPITKWHMTTIQMVDYIQSVVQNETFASLSFDEQEAFRKFVYKLLDQDDITALRIYSYSCSIGTEIFEKNPKEAEKAYKKLVSLKEDPFSTTQLGIMYYNGELNQGIPQYDKALQYLTIGSTFGDSDAMLCLGDMMMDGKGMPRSGKGAYNLYKLVYQASEEDFLNGDPFTSFADAAYRMGRCFEEGSGVKQDLMVAYDYMLRAKLGVQAKTDVNGNLMEEDEEAQRDIDEGIMILKKQLGEDTEEVVSEYSLSYLIRKNLRDGYAFKLTWLRLDMDTYRFVLQRIEKPKVNDDLHKILEEDVNTEGLSRMLICVPRMSACLMSDQVVLYANGASIVDEGTKGFIFDSINDHNQNGMIQFYYDGVNVGKILAKNYLFKRDDMTDHEHGFKVEHMEFPDDFEFEENDE